MHGISNDKKPKNVGKFPLLSVDTLAGVATISFAFVPLQILRRTRLVEKKS